MIPSLSLLPFVKQPVLLMLNLTEKCNLRCTYCFGKYYEDKEHLSLPQLQTILLGARKMGIMRLSISGGDPLMHPEFDQILAWAVEQGFEVGVNSNGILVPQHLESLKKAANLTISLDSADAQIHDQFRGKNAHKKALEGIHAALQKGIPVHIAMTLTSANLQEWLQVLQLAEELGVYLQISPLYNFIEDNRDQTTQDYNERLRQELGKIHAASRTSQHLFFTDRVYRLLQDWPKPGQDVSRTKVQGHPTCVAGIKSIFVDNQGRLFACQRFSKEEPGVDLLTTDFETAYRSLSRPDCLSCAWACYLNFNLLLTFHPRAVLKQLKMRAHKKKSPKA